MTAHFWNTGDTCRKQLEPVVRVLILVLCWSNIGPLKQELPIWQTCTVAVYFDHTTGYFVELTLPRFPQYTLLFPDSLRVSQFDAQGIARACIHVTTDRSRVDSVQRKRLCCVVDNRVKVSTEITLQVEHLGIRPLILHHDRRTRITVGFLADALGSCASKHELFVRLQVSLVVVIGLCKSKVERGGFQSVRVLLVPCSALRESSVRQNEGDHVVIVFVSLTVVSTLLSPATVKDFVVIFIPHHIVTGLGLIDQTDQAQRVVRMTNHGALVRGQDVNGDGVGGFIQDRTKQHLTNGKEQARGTVKGEIENTVGLVDGQIRRLIALNRTAHPLAIDGRQGISGPAHQVQRGVQLGVHTVEVLRLEVGLELFLEQIVPIVVINAQ